MADKKIQPKAAGSETVANKTAAGVEKKSMKQNRKVTAKQTRKVTAKQTRRKHI